MRPQNGDLNQGAGGKASFSGSELDFLPPFNGYPKADFEGPLKLPPPKPAQRSFLAE